MDSFDRAFIKRGKMSRFNLSQVLKLEMLLVNSS